MEDCCRYIEEFKVSGFWHIDTTLNAATHGHLECLKYARENGCPLHERTSLIAAFKGQLDCLKYAHENGCPWNSDATSNSAAKGHLECLKYAHENGCPWDIGTTFIAAQYGHLDCLKYAHENGCPLDEQATLSHLEKHVSKIDLDDKWWRSFLFEKDLTSHLILKNLVHTKKEEIKNLQEKSTSLFSHISKDLTKYILWTYF
jgi:hypothetical protein